MSDTTASLATAYGIGDQCRPVTPGPTWRPHSPDRPHITVSDDPPAAQGRALRATFEHYDGHHDDHPMEDVAERDFDRFVDWANDGRKVRVYKTSVAFGWVYDADGDVEGVRMAVQQVRIFNADWPNRPPAKGGAVAVYLIPGDDRDPAAPITAEDVARIAAYPEGGVNNVTVLHDWMRNQYGPGGVPKPVPLVVAQELKRLHDMPVPIPDIPPAADATGAARYRWTPDDGTLNSLMARTIAPVSWIVDSLMPEGLTLLTARPKIGKSVLVLDIATALIGADPVLDRFGHGEPAEVLIISLEDHERRFKKRMRERGATDMPAEQRKRMHIRYTWRPLDDGGLDDLKKFLDDHPNCRFVSIDTIAHLRRGRKGGESIYDFDLSVLKPLWTIANERHIAILTVFHDRKQEAEDWLDSVGGSLGLSGTADTVWRISRKRGERIATLHMTGRDIDEGTVGLQFDRATNTYRAVDADAAAPFAPTADQERLLGLLRQSGAAGATPTVLAEDMGKSRTAVHNMLVRLAERTVAYSNGAGRWFAHAATPAGGAAGEVFGVSEVRTENVFDPGCSNIGSDAVTVE